MASRRSLLPSAGLGQETARPSPGRREDPAKSHSVSSPALAQGLSAGFAGPGVLRETRASPWREGPLSNIPLPDPNGWILGLRDPLPPTASTTPFTLILRFVSSAQISPLSCRCSFIIRELSAGAQRVLTEQPLRVPSQKLLTWSNA